MRPRGGMGRLRRGTGRPGGLKAGGSGRWPWPLCKGRARQPGRLVSAEGFVRDRVRSGKPQPCTVLRSLKLTKSRSTGAQTVITGGGDEELLSCLVVSERLHRKKTFYTGHWVYTVQHCSELGRGMCSSQSLAVLARHNKDNENIPQKLCVQVSSLSSHSKTTLLILLVLPNVFFQVFFRGSCNGGCALLFITAPILQLFSKLITSKRLCFCFKSCCSVYMVTNRMVLECGCFVV